MSTITITTRQQQKTDISTNWTANNPILLVGEIGIESNTGKIKVGNGITAWASLAYIGITTEYLQANYLPKSNPTVIDSITLDSTTDSITNKIQYAQTSPMNYNMGVKGVMLTTNSGGDEGGLLIHGDGAYLWNSTDSGFALKVMDEDTWSTATLKKDATFTNGLLFSIDASGNVKCKGKFYDTSGANIVSGGESIPYFDLIIQTQAEFTSMYNSSTWLGATSVAFIGDGGDLEFTRNDTVGLQIPSTVKRIQGFNNAIINITTHSASSSDIAGLWYSSKPTTNDYSIKDITITTNLTNAYPIDYGISNCINLINCISTVTGSSTQGAHSAFYNCTNIINCIGTGGNGYRGAGFQNCTNAINCTGKSVGGYVNSGFDTCYGVINCSGEITSGTTASGFYACSRIVNCEGWGTASSGGTGYVFRNCSYASNCTKKSGPGVTSGIWGGTNTYIDSDTCEDY